MPSHELLVGAAKVNITPPLSIPFLGFYPERQGCFSGVHDPLWARAAVFAGTDSALAILSADAIGLSRDLFGPGRDFVAEVRERAASGTGLTPANIMLTATHAHSVPETYGITRLWEREGCQPWLEVWADQLATAIRLAWSDRRPARLSRGAANVHGLARNRRGHFVTDGTTPALDETLSVLLAERGASGPVIVANAACHPVTVQVQPLVSADFPGVALATAEKALGRDSACLFVQGAAGDINPVRNATRDWHDVDTYATILAGGILQAVGRARLAELGTAPCVIATARSSVLLPARDAPTEEQALRDLQAAERELAETPEDGPDRGARRARAAAANEAYHLARFGPQAVPAEIQCLRIADTALAGVPGELFSGLGLRLKRRVGPAMTMVAELANGCLGYLPARADWEAGGYEVGLGPWCRTAAGAGERIVEEAERCLAQLFPEPG